MNFFYLLLDDNTLEFRPVSCKPLVVALPNIEPCRLDIHTWDRIVPGLQHLEVGDLVRRAPERFGLTPVGSSLGLSQA